MKNLTLLVCLMAFSFISFGQQSINKFYKQFKKESNGRSIAVPGFVFKIGAAVSKKKVKDDSVAVMGLDLAKKIKGMKVLMVEDYYLGDEPITNFLDNARNKSGMEDLFMMKAAETDIHFMMKDEGDLIKNLVILMASDDGIMMMSMKSKLSKKEIGELINMAIRQANEGEEEEKTKDSKPVVVEPRA